MSPAEAPERDVEEPLGMVWSAERIGIVVAVLLMVIFWAAIFGGAFDKENPDRITAQDGNPAGFDAEAFVDGLESRCLELRADLAELPNAADAETQAARADVLDDANVLVAEFIADLEAGAPAEGPAAESMAGWIADWNLYLDNREDYADRLRTEPNAKLLLDESTLGGDGVDKAIEIFAQVNAIEDACATPGDVG